MKKIILFLSFIPYFCFSQNINIYIHDDNNPFPPVIDTLVIYAYQEAGFSNIETTLQVIDSTLLSDDFDVLIVKEGYIFSFAVNNWIPNPINESEQQIVENFVLQGGHVVWISESWENVNPNKALSSINNIYGTNLVNGPWFGLQYGNPNIYRIHPSSGPGGLSESIGISATGSYSTTLNVPNCNKLYTSFEQDGNFNNYSPCTHTTIALFPAKPKPNLGSILLSNELGIPFQPISAGFFNIFNTVFDNSVARLHYNLLVDEVLSYNQWNLDENNSNSNCPAPVFTNVEYSDTTACVGDTVYFYRESDTVMVTSFNSETILLNIGYYNSPCSNDTTISVKFEFENFDAGEDELVCIGDELTLSIENSQQFDTLYWSNGVINNIAFTPDQNNYYTLTTEKNGCISKDSLYVSIIEKPNINLNFSNDSVCLGEGIILNAEIEPTGTELEWNNGVLNNQVLTPNETSSYIINASNMGCMNKDSVIIYVIEPPKINTPEDISTCLNNFIELEATTDNGAELKWSDNIQNNIPFQVIQNKTFYISSEQYGCISYDSVTVNIFQDLKADFNFEISPHYNSFLISLKNTSSIGPDLNYQWIFEDSLNSNYTDFDLDYYANSSLAELNITLIVSDGKGCSDTITKNLFLDKSLIEIIYIPDAFTPNNDNTNDIFKPILNSNLDLYQFTIFNR
jgi:hypothetical protein